MRNLYYEERIFIGILLIFFIIGVCVVLCYFISKTYIIILAITVSIILLFIVSHIFLKRIYIPETNSENPAQSPFLNDFSRS